MVELFRRNNGLMKRYKYMLFNFILGASIICIMIFAVYSYIDSLNPEYVSGIGKFKFMHMITGSMKPEINIDDIIITRAVDAGSLETGDIITFRTSGNMLVTHRIKHINEDGSFITKGDANAMEDIGLKVNRDNIVGKYFFKIPKGAYIVEFFQSFSGMLIFLLLLVLLLQSNAKRIINVIRKKVNMPY